MNLARFCLVGATALSLAPIAGAQFLVDRQITIQPIQVTSGATVGNPSQTLWEAEADKIWAQAGIDIKFNSWITWESATYINPTTASLDSLAELTTGVPWAALPSTVIRVWFVNVIDGNTGVYGVTRQNVYDPEGPPFQTYNGNNGIFIANSAFSGGSPPVDTIAHEIGHALGLTHHRTNSVPTPGLIGASEDRNVMLVSPVAFPTTISNIFPDGSDLAQLNAAQVAYARQFNYAVTLPANQQYTYPAVPEPAHYAGIAGALMFGAALWRRRRSYSVPAGKQKTRD